MESNIDEADEHPNQGGAQQPLRSLGPRWFAAGMVLLALGTVGSALIGSWFWPWGSPPATQDPLWWNLGALVGAMVLGVAIMLVSFGSSRDAGARDDADRGRYSRHLTGLGFALLIVALSTAISAAGLVRNRWIEVSGTDFQQAFAEEVGRGAGSAGEPVLAPGTRVGLILLLSTEMSILGALFFVTNRLRKKRDKPEGGTIEAFDSGRFWGGLFFRISEAVLFTFAFFWLFWEYVSANGAPYFTGLPILALFLGMFVKTGEQMIFGLGERLLAAAAQLFPIPPSDGGGS